MLGVPFPRHTSLQVAIFFRSPDIRRGQLRDERIGLGECVGFVLAPHPLVVDDDIEHTELVALADRFHGSIGTSFSNRVRQTGGTVAVASRDAVFDRDLEPVDGGQLCGVSCCLGYSRPGFGGCLGLFTRGHEGSKKEELGSHGESLALSKGTNASARHDVTIFWASLRRLLPAARPP